MHQKLVDLRPMLDEPNLRRILALAIGFPTPEKVHQVCQRYRCEPQREILGALEDGQIIGCIGLGLSHERQVEILHIAVDPQHHRRGIGRWMCEQIRDRIHRTGPPPSHRLGPAHSVPSEHPSSASRRNPLT